VFTFTAMTVYFAYCMCYELMQWYRVYRVSVCDAKSEIVIAIILFIRSPVCPSVYPSRLNHSSIVSKRLNLSSKFLYCLLALLCYFPQN